MSSKYLCKEADDFLRLPICWALPALLPALSSDGDITSTPVLFVSPLAAKDGEHLKSLKKRDGKIFLAFRLENEVFVVSAIAVVIFW